MGEMMDDFTQGRKYERNIIISEFVEDLNIFINLYIKEGLFFWHLEECKNNWEEKQKRLK